MEQETGIAVIGAGAAGIAACRTLAANGRSSLLIEARRRSGGRAWTETHAGHPLDLGCGWLHSSDVNPLVPLARDLCLHVDETIPPWQRVLDSEAFGAAEQRDFRKALGAFYERVGQAARSDEDQPAANMLEAGAQWNGLIDAVSTYVNGVELDRLSVKDFWNYEDSETNYRVVEGYGALFERLAEGLPAVYGCRARRIDHSGARIRIETDNGALSADAVIVTLPTNILAQEKITITPALPDKCHAAACLPLGVADKLFLHVEKPEDLPENYRLYGARDRTATGGYHMRPFGRPLIEGYFGGQCARELEREGLAGFTAFAIEEICGMLGNVWRTRLSPVVASSWARDEHSLGSYSHALPGHWDKRAVLAAPVDNRIFFAGEATHPHFFSTAHGAWESGIRAAQEAMGQQ